MILQKTIKVGTLVRTIDVYTSPEQGCVAVCYSKCSKTFTDIGDLEEYLSEISDKINAEMQEIHFRNAELNAFLKGNGFIPLPDNKVM